MVLVSKKNRKILLYIVAVVASIFLLVGLIVILSTNDHGKKQEGKIGKNNYKIVTGKEYEDVTVITNDTLKKEHCLDDISEILFTETKFPDSLPVHKSSSKVKRLTSSSFINDFKLYFLSM